MVTRKVSVKKTDDTKCWWEYEETRTCLHCNGLAVTPSAEYNAELTAGDIPPKKWKCVATKTCTRMFIAALIVTS